MDRDNYGIQEETELRPTSSPGLMSAADERSWSALAHLSALACTQTARWTRRRLWYADGWPWGLTLELTGRLRSG